ncbi:WD40 repeat domain-containing protein [Streptomyces sp. NPDC012466]|uniref:WD40 repeat domain-containing protein n=1 Tax=Streptomyces sp. NPDC012466 TaxID=3364835 RepID=UPI0036ECCA32
MRDLTGGALSDTWVPQWIRSERGDDPLPVITAVAITVLDGHPVAVTAGADTACVWDLADGSRVGEISVGAGEDIAIAPLAGRPVVAVLGHRSGRVALWDVAHGDHMSDLPAEEITAVAAVTIGACPVVVTGHEDGMVHLWDLTTRRQVGRPLAGHETCVGHVTTALVDGRAVAITGGRMDLDCFWDGDVRVWDLGDGKQLTSFPAAGSPVSAAAVTVVGGRPVVTTGFWDGRLEMRDMMTGHALRTCRAESLGFMIHGSSGVRALQGTVLRGRPVVLAGHDDGTVRIWDVPTGEQVGATLRLPLGQGAFAQRRPGRSVRLAVGPGDTLVACAGREVVSLNYGGAAPAKDSI